MRIITLLFFTILLLQNCTTPTTSATETPKEVKTTATKTSMLRHIVLFKFKDDAKAADIKTLENAFRELPKHIAAIKDFEWGYNNSPEELEQGFTHCFFVSFADEAGREVYLPHPKHLEFVKLLGPVLDKVLVFDYETKL